jgi:Ca-activated chloride channel family protein
MKQALLVLIFFCSCSSLYSQYYLRGEVRDEKGNALQGVKINLSSKGRYPFYSGASGLFGLPTEVAIDTITISMDGFETLKKAVDTKIYQILTIKPLAATINVIKTKLASRTKNLMEDKTAMFSVLGESYSSLVENNFIEAAQYPETGFGLNIDKASYSNIRRFISNEMNVPTDAVRIEEMLNYFNFLDKKENTSHTDFTCTSKITTCPWNNNNQLLFLHLTAPKLNLDAVPPSNLVFLIDVSGSMERPNRLPLLQSAFKLLAENLREKDTVSIVTYGGYVANPLKPTSGKEKQKIMNVLDSLVADGDTPGENAIRTAYDIAKHAFIKNGNNRVILATDGDFNVGQTTEKQLEDLITIQRQSGIYLTCIGVGMGNYKDSKLETLAKKGNGNSAYLDNINEAEKLLVTEFTQTLFAVANDAFTTVNFNPDIVKSYRLIGFDNKKNAINDSTSELEGGEVGSGHNMMALFEIEPQKEIKDSTAPIARLNLQYKLPESKKLVSQKFILPNQVENFYQSEPVFRFTTAVAMFGSLLKHSNFVKNYSYEDVLTIATNSAEMNSRIQQEFLTLVQKADKLYNYKKRKR